MTRRPGRRFVAHALAGAALAGAIASASAAATPTTTARARASAPAPTSTPAPTSAPAPQPSRNLAITARPRELPYGRSTVISGTLTGADAVAPGAAIAGESLELQASRYPFGGYRDVGHAQTAADGSFSFHPLHPDRNTRFKVVDLGMPAVSSAPLTVLVDAPAVQRVYRRRDGQAMVTVLSYHGRDLNWSGRPVYWFAAPFGSRSFMLMTVTRTHDLRPGVTYMTATFYAPAGHFVYRVCFDPPLEQAFGPPHASCPTSGFVLPRRHGKAR